MHIHDLIQEAHALGASDVHISPDTVPVFRLAGKLVHAQGICVCTDEQINEWLVDNAGWTQGQTALEQSDFAMDSLGGAVRLRITVYPTDRGTSLAIRMLSKAPPSPDAIQMPTFLRELSAFSSGLVLVTGPTGSGKSTTLGSWIVQSNQREASHIITVEDPIEYVFSHGKGLVNQCEVGTHFTTFTDALSDILRRDPDVIMAGELRDLDSVRLAIRAAETGHLVLATLHSANASDAVSRIINIFPSDSEQFIRHVVSDVLLGVVAQRLVPSVAGVSKQGRVANYEVLTATPAVRHLILDRKEAQLQACIQTGAQQNMFTFAQHQQVLLNAGLISNELG